MKSKNNIKKELGNQYFGEEADNYDYNRTQDIRTSLMLEKNKKIIFNILSKKKIKTILDVACGTGFYFSSYPCEDIYGIDISKEMLKQAKSKKNVKLAQVGDAENLPFKENFFDAVISTRFIMHTPDYEKVISEMKRVVKKNGLIILDFPNKYSLSYIPTKLRILKGELRHYNLFSKSKIINLSKKMNLEIVSISPTVIFSAMFLPKFLSKFSMNANNFLLKIFPQLSYVFYTVFRKK